jgi:hypothetical protein
MQRDDDGSLGRAMMASANEERISELEKAARAEMERIVPSLALGDGGKRELRDWFAGMALQGLVSAWGPGMAAQEAYKYADEMLKARDA